MSKYENFIKTMYRISRRMNRKAFMSAAAVVVFVTTYLLILPAFTQTNQTYCGKEEHTHSEACYQTEKILICLQEETEGHVHDESCYSEVPGDLICGQEETEGHLHQEECYDEEGNLICELEEKPAHLHTEECYGTKQELTCQLEEVAPHTHGEACYEEQKTFVCTKEEHTHDKSCFSNANADVETSEIWERTMRDVEFTENWAEDVLSIAKTQLGYKESTSNYIVDETGRTKGYSRYGAWYGDRYGDWCAMFVSFCIHYANIPREYMPIDCSCQNWIQKLNTEQYRSYYAVNDQNSYTVLTQGEAYTPQPGDLIFFNWDQEPDADHVGLVYSYEPATENKAAVVTTLEGNASDTVKYNTYSMTNSCIMGFARLPENPNPPRSEEELTENTSDEEENSETGAESDETEEQDALIPEEILPEERFTKSYDGADYTITVSYTAAANLPEDAELTVRELEGEEYEQALAQAQTAMSLDSVSFARFFDISFLAGEEKIEPEAPVEVMITYRPSVEIPQEETGNAVHFADTGLEILGLEKKEEEDGSTSLVFEQESFSVTGTVYGVSTLAEDDGIATLADEGYSAAPPVGNVTGIVVREPIIGEWYMIYGYNGATNSHVLPENWPNRGSMNSWAQSPCPTLSQATDTLGGAVTYTGSDDVVWQYLGNGSFVNRHGYAMYMRTVQNSDGSYSTEFSVTNRLNEQYSVDYSWEHKAIYNYNTTYQKYNVLMIDSNGYSDHGYPYNSIDNMTSPRVGTPQYLAQVTGLDVTDGGHDNHPVTSVTGKADLSKPVLYSIDATQPSMVGVPGVTYTITNTSTGESIGVITDNSIDVTLPTLPAGTYTVEQTAVPSGYVVTSQKREFTVDSSGQGQPGIFYLYKEGDFQADKTGQVVDYVNRIYQVDLTAKSGKYSYEVDPVNLIMVVDQSNSMLFPQTLNPVTGATVRLYRNGSGENRTNDARMLDLVNNGVLKKNTTYYLVTDDDGDTATSTVYAIFWDGSGWCYQDASYYSKAYRHWKLDDETNVKESNAYVEFARSDEEYVGTKHGGSLSELLKDKFEKDLGSSGNNYKDYQLYTGSEFNRLHELQQAVVALAGLVSSLNNQSTMTIETFAKDLYGCSSYTLNSDGVLQVLNAANQITTRGGTRQDLALRHVYGDYNTGTITHSTHLTDDDDYVILITDGAPNVTGGGTNSIETVVQVATTLKGQMSDEDKLITVGLGGGYVGGTMLERSASAPSSDYYRKVEESGALTTYFMNLFMQELSKNRKTVSAEADIVDVVSDSFYITDRNGNALSAGDRINLNGDPDPSGPGLICYGPIDGENQWYVVWDDQTLGTGESGSASATKYYFHSKGGASGETVTELDTSQTYYVTYGDERNLVSSTSGSPMWFDGSEWRVQYSWQSTPGTIPSRFITSEEASGAAASPAWKGRIYLKAKEDFIGGNTIDTNKSATVSINNADHTSSGTGISLPTPTVNVRLLEMKGFESEETIFLGDEVTSIRDKIQTLLKQTVIDKIKDSTGNQMNYKEGATEANGCYEDYFTIPYAIRDLTEDEWNRLLNGETISIEYTYDDASSHGAVGYFSFSLTKTFKEEKYSTYNDHVSEVSGTDVEMYTLTVTYTAYGIGESDTDQNQRKDNVHNGTNGPGTEVGTGSDIPYGAGTESVREIHHVHVIDGEIFVTKTIDESLISDQDQIYVFELYEKDPVTGEAKGTVLTTIEVEVKAGQTSGTNHSEPLPRDNYIVKEASSNDYLVTQVEVVTDDTNCDYVTSMPSLEFDIGTNPQSTDGKDPEHNVILYNSTKPEDSTWVLGKRYVYSAPFTTANFDESDTGGSSSGDDTGGSSSGSDTGGSTSGGDTGGGSSGSSSSGTHTETREVEVYAWSSGTIISTDVSGSQYTRLDETADELNASHTNYGILTQDATNEDEWTVTWTTWKSEESATSTPMWPVGTIISTNVSGNTYDQLPNTADYYDGIHQDYGILKKNSSGEWVIEWHRWTESAGSSSGGNMVTITFYQWKWGQKTGETITVPANQPVTITYTATDPWGNDVGNPGYWPGNRDANSCTQLSKTAVAGAANRYQTTLTPTADTSFCYSTSDSNVNGTLISSSADGAGTSTWSDHVTTEGADSSKIPSTSSTTTIWSSSASEAAAEHEKIPKTTKTIEVEVPDEPGDSGEGGSGETSGETITSDKLSVGHGKIWNTKANYQAEIPVQKTWDDGGTHSRDEVYVVLYDKDGAPVNNEDGNAMMLKLNAANSWQGSFTVSVPSKDYNPLQDGYQLREVNDKRTNVFTDSVPAVLVNDTSDTTVYYVKTAAENEVVIVNNTAYNAHYKNVGDRMLVVQNNKAYELPKTGGLGTIRYTMGGIGLIITALVLYGFSLRRRRERRLL